MTSLDLDLINERNTYVLHDVRAERLRGGCARTEGHASAPAG